MHHEPWFFGTIYVQLEARKRATSGTAKFPPKNHGSCIIDDCILLRGAILRLSGSLISGGTPWRSFATRT